MRAGSACHDTEYPYGHARRETALIPNDSYARAAPEKVNLLIPGRSCEWTPVIG